MADLFGLLPLLRVVHLSAFGHDEHLCLCLTASTTLQRLILLPIGDFGGEKALIHLNAPQEGVLVVTFAHDIPQLVHHLPYWLIALVAELALHLTGGERVLGGGQQMDCLEPVHKGQLAVVHHSVGRQCGLVPTSGATPALVMAVPIVLLATTLLANNARLLSLSLEIRLAGSLVRKTLGKFK